MVKLKLPPSATDPKLGWRIEIRPMEAQLTDFQNAAFVVFIGLLTRALLYKKSDFAVPMKKLCENITRAKRKDAVLNEKFYFPSDETEEHLL